MASSENSIGQRTDVCASDHGQNDQYRPWSPHPKQSPQVDRFDEEVGGPSYRRKARVVGALAVNEADMAAQLSLAADYAMKMGIRYDEVLDAIKKLAEAGEKGRIAGIAWRTTLMLVEDISDRRGIKHEWNKIDEDVKEEIVLTWARFIEKAIWEEVNSRKEDE